MRYLSMILSNTSQREGHHCHSFHPVQQQQQQQQKQQQKQQLRPPSLPLPLPLVSRSTGNKNVLTKKTIANPAAALLLFFLILLGGSVVSAEGLTTIRIGGSGSSSRSSSSCSIFRRPPPPRKHMVVTSTNTGSGGGGGAGSGSGSGSNRIPRGGGGRREIVDSTPATAMRMAATSTSSSSEEEDGSNLRNKCPVSKSMAMFGAVWGSLGVVYILAKAIVRVLPIALEPFLSSSSSSLTLTPIQWGCYALSCAFFAYAEGYKGFQLKFSPLVVKRSLTLMIGTPQGTVWNYLLAPLYSMGLIHATKKRLITSWSVTMGVATVVAIVKRLPPVGRCILDAGVVVGLTWGSLSILWYFVKAWMTGLPPNVDPCLPESSGGGSSSSSGRGRKDTNKQT